MSAIDATLRRAIARRGFTTAIIKDSKAYKRLRAELAMAYKNAWNDNTKRAVARALDTANDLGKQITQADIDVIYKVLAADLGGAAMLEQLRRPTVNLGSALFKVGAKEVGNVAFQTSDLDTLELINDSNLYWIGQSWDTKTDGIIKDELRELFTDGMTREQLTAELAQRFNGIVDKGASYWDLLADHTATKTREMGRVTGYERSAVRYVRVQAFLDNKTSAVCRRLHGKLIPVTRMAKQRDRYLAAVGKRNTNAAIKAWPMYTEKKLPGKEVGMPPYHFRCRTITVAYQSE